MTDFVWATQDALRDKLYDRIDDLETANADLLEALEYIYDNADREDVVVAATERIIRKHKGEGK